MRLIQNHYNVIHYKGLTENVMMILPTLMLALEYRVLLASLLIMINVHYIRMDVFQMVHNASMSLHVLLLDLKLPAKEQMDALIHRYVSRMLLALNSNIRILVLKLEEKIVFGQIMLVEI